MEVAKLIVLTRLQAQAAAAAAAAGSSEAAAQSSSPRQPHALAVFRRPRLGASPRLSSAFELPAVVGALGYSLSPVQVSCSRPGSWQAGITTSTWYLVMQTWQHCACSRVLEVPALIGALGYPLSPVLQGCCVREVGTQQARGKLRRQVFQLLAFPSLLISASPAPFAQPNVARGSTTCKAKAIFLPLLCRLCRAAWRAAFSARRHPRHTAPLPVKLPSLFPPSSQGELP